MKRIRLAEMTVSAPAIIWLAYAAVVVGACFLSNDIWPLVMAAFSFQFWCYAAWRGMMKEMNK